MTPQVEDGGHTSPVDRTAYRLRHPGTAVAHELATLRHNMDAYTAEYGQGAGLLDPHSLCKNQGGMAYPPPTATSRRPFPSRRALPLPQLHTQERSCSTSPCLCTSSPCWPSQIRRRTRWTMWQTCAQPHSNICAGPSRHTYPPTACVVSAAGAPSHKWRWAPHTGHSLPIPDSDALHGAAASRYRPPDTGYRYASATRYAAVCGRVTSTTDQSAS